MAYEPKQGDIIMLDFDPQTGHEQKGRRPALVISNDAFHKRTNLAMVCPITSRLSNFPTHILLNGKIKTIGEVMCEQAKCLDIKARNASFVEATPYEAVEEMIDMICSFVE